MVFQYLKHWHKDFWFQSFFLLKYFLKVIDESMADSQHPKSFSERFSRGCSQFGKAFKILPRPPHSPLTSEKDFTSLKTWYQSCHLYDSGLADSLVRPPGCFFFLFLCCSSFQLGSIKREQGLWPPAHLMLLKCGFISAFEFLSVNFFSVLFILQTRIFFSQTLGKQNDGNRRKEDKIFYI
jgi:hypothetical protein